MTKTVHLQLVAAKHGFDDFDVTGHETVHRVCIPRGLKNGDIFNVYGPPGTKHGATWRGSIESSLCEHLGADRVVVKRTCKICGSTLDADAFCEDLTCVHHDWPQNVDRVSLSEMTTEEAEKHFGVQKRRLDVMLDVQTDEHAMKQWKDYMDRKVPVVIYPATAPKDAGSKFAVCPEENQSWWLGGFGSAESAQTFCTENGLKFTVLNDSPI